MADQTDEVRMFFGEDPDIDYQSYDYLNWSKIQEHQEKEKKKVQNLFLK